MIGKQTKGSNFRGLLNYLIAKPGASLIGGNLASSTVKELAKEFSFSGQLNSKVQRSVYHVSLSVPAHERQEDGAWCTIARRYLQEMGFDQNQYVVFRHCDRDHDHIHVVASRIRLDGSCVQDSWDYRRSETILRQIEQDYDLSRTPSSSERDQRSLTTGERRLLARTGERSVRVKLQQMIDAITQTSRSLPELIEQLQDQQIEVWVTPRGVSYELDQLHFAGTDLGKAYTLPGLQKHRGVDYDPIRDDDRIRLLMHQFRVKRWKNATLPDSKELETDAVDSQSMLPESNSSRKIVKLSYEMQPESSTHQMEL